MDKLYKNIHFLQFQRFLTKFHIYLSSVTIFSLVLYKNKNQRHFLSKYLPFSLDVLLGPKIRDTYWIRFKKTICNKN